MNKAKKSKYIDIVNNFVNDDSKFGLTIIIKILKPLNVQKISELRFNLHNKNIKITKIKSSLLKKINEDISTKGNVFAIFDDNCIALNILKEFNKNYPQSIEIVFALNNKTVLKKNMTTELEGCQSKKMIYNSIVRVLTLPQIMLSQILKQIGEKSE